MPVINRIAEFYNDMAAWRQHIHQNPELGFDCFKTAEFIVARLKEFGIDEVTEGWAKTGVVAVINGKGAGGTIGLRADMDALPMTEEAGLSYTSKNAGAMHACGHDGHTTMLLGAAKYLTETRNFSGRVVLIFQPAEENGGGGGVMCEEGLIETFGISQIYALHNIPGLPVGHFETRTGPMMAAVDDFEVIITGQGGHAAHPNKTIDPIVVATHLVQAVQTMVSRNIDPVEHAVVSVTEIHAGSAFNVIPEIATLKGTLRSFKPEVKAVLRTRLAALAEHIAAAYGGAAEVVYHDGYPATVNHPAETEFAARVAGEVIGPDHVTADVMPSMGSEDFAYMLKKCPGAYLYIGNGESAGLHHPKFDFNDAVSPIGASFFARLVEVAQPV